MKLSEELIARGLIAQVTEETEVYDLIDNGKAVFYIGFDPTADSLHVGHFLQLCTMKRLQAVGNKPIALVGGGTGMVGDPSGRSDLRQVMTEEMVNQNVKCMKKQIEQFIDFSNDKALLINNADWLLDLNYVEFLREIGVHFSVNRMLAAECYKQRLENGLSFLEFNYMLMQSYDFYKLSREYGCNLQVGGDDQWSNLLGGMELIRRKDGQKAYGMTLKLLLTSEGKKMGKTAKGAVWLDPDKTSPFEFYQYWRNVSDADVIHCLKELTFIPIEDILAIEKDENKDINECKRLLAYELTKMVHGKQAASEAKLASESLFGDGVSLEYVPTLELYDGDFFNAHIDILSILQKSKFVQSRSEGRRLIEQGGVELNGEKILDISEEFDKCFFEGPGVLLKKGKKKFIKVMYIK